MLFLALMDLIWDKSRVLGRLLTETGETASRICCRFEPVAHGAAAASFASLCLQQRRDNQKCLFAVNQQRQARNGQDLDLPKHIRI